MWSGRIRNDAVDLPAQVGDVDFPARIFAERTDIAGRSYVGSDIGLVDRPPGEHLERSNKARAVVRVEIGPGQGALTRPLLDDLNTLNAIELDRDLIAHLS